MASGDCCGSAAQANRAAPSRAARTPSRSEISLEYFQYIFKTKPKSMLKNLNRIVKKFNVRFEIVAEQIKYDSRDLMHKQSV